MTRSGLHRFELCPVPPFRLDFTAWALRRRPDNAVDRFDGVRYERVLDLGGEPLAVAVMQIAPPDSPSLIVELVGRGRPATARQAEVAAVLTRTLGLDRDLSAFYRMAEGDERLADLITRFRGLRPVRFPSIFEALVNAIACQQLSLTVGIRLLGRLATRFGKPAPGRPGHRGFPAPDHLANAAPTALRELGFSTAKARATVGLATLVADGSLDLESLASANNDEIVARLVQLPGIGRWSAEYALLRGYGRLDVLPGDDVGARHSLQRRFGLSGDAGYADVKFFAEAWFPYGGLVYFHLLLDGLDRLGIVTPSPHEASGGLERDRLQSSR